MVFNGFMFLCLIEQRLQRWSLTVVSLLLRVTTESMILPSGSSSIMNISTTRTPPGVTPTKTNKAFKASSANSSLIIVRCILRYSKLVLQRICIISCETLWLAEIENAHFLLSWNVKRYAHAIVYAIGIFRRITCTINLPG